MSTFFFLFLLVPISITYYSLYGYSIWNYFNFFFFPWLLICICSPFYTFCYYFLCNYFCHHVVWLFQFVDLFYSFLVHFPIIHVLLGNGVLSINILYELYRAITLFYFFILFLLYVLLRWIGLIFFHFLFFLLNLFLFHFFFYLNFPLEKKIFIIIRDCFMTRILSIIVKIFDVSLFIDL